ncbi:MAG: hypothetical protein MUC50_08145 [Myxococcota bacterium]|nr:hypothetical protein [Myxococcota bacterium]
MPPPRVNLVRYHGVLAPKAKDLMLWRDQRRTDGRHWGRLSGAIGLSGLSEPP